MGQGHSAANRRIKPANQLNSDYLSNKSMFRQTGENLLSYQDIVVK